MKSQILINDIEIFIERKNIKNMYIRIQPPDGAVKITAPKFISDDTIHAFAFAKIAWIKKQRVDIKHQPRQMNEQYISGESHFLWGKKYRLEVMDFSVHKDIYIEGETLFLPIKKENTKNQREMMLNEWYREQIKQAIPVVLKKYIGIVGKEPSEWRVKNMRTRWGTCNTTKKRIWLNLQLAKKEPECLEYVIVHELVHLYVKNHNAEFRLYMEQFYPNWERVERKLNERIIEDTIEGAIENVL